MTRPLRPIRTLFIANRGEIAARIARTAVAMGITPVAAETSGPNAVDLLDADAVVGAAATVGADALHPGYGFLSENAAFADAVLAAGIRWVGPPPAAIRAMGDKAAARRLAASLGVPVLPGYDGADQSDGTLAAAAERIGVPLLVKPSGGGGGKGMRIVRSLDGLPDALAAARREARAAFGDDRLILERFVEGPRHVEMQVLFDRHGAGVSLGERDCSLQRRQQKVLEESPSAAVDAGLRQRMGDAAVRLASAVGYASAGTVEFLLDDRGTFSFLEMNTRLQVEHPVTEAVTGRDLVADQLRLAAGLPLGEVLSGRTSPGAAAAVEVRLYAEDADDGFLPATGRVVAVRWPEGDGIRVDAGIAAGDDIGGRFDPMLAKIVAWGESRAQAYDRLVAALDATSVLGVVTNLRFLRWLVRQDVVRTGQARIDTLGRIWPPDGWAAQTAIPDAAWAGAAHRLADRPGDAWSGGWRLNAAPSVRVVADGVERSIRPDGGAIGVAAGAGQALDSVGQASAWPWARDGDTVHVEWLGRSVAFRLGPAPAVDEARRSTAAGRAGAAEVRSPMPGAVLATHAAVGASVDVGAPLVTIEAMKMEHVVPSPAGGVVAEILVATGDQVAKGQVVAVVRADPGAPE